MNDLHLDGVDLRTALHRDAELVGDPSPDLLDQLYRRRVHQHRQRVGLIAVAAAVALIGAGIPVVSSIAMRSHAAPATQTTSPTSPQTSEDTSPSASAPISPASSSAAAATTTSIVTAWARQSFHGVSFVVPADAVTPKIDEHIPPSDAFVYNWNNGFGDTATPVSVSASASQVAPDGQPLGATYKPINVPGASSAFYDIEPFPFEDGRPTMTMTTVQVVTPDWSYSVMILVPRDADGDHIAQQFVMSIRVTGSTPPCDWDAIDAALPANTAENTYRLVRGQGELCSGVWAAAGYTQVITGPDGQQHSDGQAGLFRYVDGSWTFLPRLEHCNDPGIPRAVWERACNVD